MSGADLSRLVAIVPVRSLSGGKSRLGEPLDPEERADLVVGLMRGVVRAARAARSVASVVVVSPDPDVLRLAADEGATPLLQLGEGLNEALEAAREASPQASALVVLPADLPELTGESIDELAARATTAAAAGPSRPLVALVPDRHGTGTNALLLSPPGAIPFRFGEGSRAAHCHEAEAAGAAYLEIAGPLTFDVDTAEDLLLADLGGLGHEGGR